MDANEIKSVPPGFEEFTEEERRMTARNVIRDSGNDPIVEEIMGKIVPDYPEDENPTFQEDPMEELKARIQGTQDEEERQSSQFSIPEIDLKRIWNIVKHSFNLGIQILKKDHLRWAILLLLALLIGLLLGFTCVPEPLPIVF